MEVSERQRAIAKAVTNFVTRALGEFHALQGVPAGLLLEGVVGVAIVEGHVTAESYWNRQRADGFFGCEWADADVQVKLWLSVVVGVTAELCQRMHVCDGHLAHLNN